MKITSLNLAGYKNWADREPLILEYLNGTQPDIIFFQEVKFNPNVSILNEASLINSKLNIPYDHTQSAISRIYMTSEGEESREGLSVLSNHPIINSEILVLRKRDDDKHTRIVQFVDIHIGGEIQKFANVHFSNNDYSDEQLEEALDVIKNRGEKRIIVGDFNIANLNTVSHLFADDYTSSISTGNYISFPSEGATFDYVLIPNEYEFNAFGIKENLSDHNALTFEI
ncbi:MAG: endonuclease/exonuclease/phosphatase family protein [Patescibacteria group bacterium]